MQRFVSCSSSLQEASVSQAQRDDIQPLPAAQFVMTQVLLLTFFLACHVAQAAIMPTSEKGSYMQVILTGAQLNQAQLLGTGKVDGG